WRCCGCPRSERFLWEPSRSAAVEEAAEDLLGYQAPSAARGCENCASAMETVATLPGWQCWACGRAEMLVGNDVRVLAPGAPPEARPARQLLEMTAVETVDALAAPRACAGCGQQMEANLSLPGWYCW